MKGREVVLSRIRSAVSGDTRPADDAIERRYRHRSDAPQEAIVEEFAERVAEYRATVHRIDAEELPAAIAAACERRGARSLAVPGDLPPEWLPEGVEIVPDDPGSRLSTDVLDRVDGVLTGCILGIAQTGTIVLDGGARQGRRVLSLLPDYHLCVVHDDQVVGLVPESFARLEEAGDSRRPITFISGPSATSDIELNRVEGVHGPRTLEVLLVQRAGVGR
jgi:L-lactate dehydrogenase complex protein LldG